MTIDRRVQLITYPDSLGGNLTALREVLEQHFAGVFGGVHLLPPFPSSGDRGFAPLDYFAIEPAFGGWSDIVRLGERHEVTLDLMVNHISRRSPYFRDFERRGRASQHADLFLTLDKIWPDGRPPAADVEKIFLRKPEHPFLDVTIEETGAVERVWTSFGPRVDWSEQIDLDVAAEATRKLLRDILVHFAANGVRLVRLDAVGYVIKKPGSSCFFVEPEIYDFLAWIEGVAAKLGLELLPEIHAHYTINRRLSARGYWTYDFVLPGLILHTLFTRSAEKLRRYLASSPPRQVTMLDCHDGIPVQPDLDGVLTTLEAKHVVDVCLARGANLNRILARGDEPPEFDAHQINCTYYAALDGDDDSYLIARAVQFFAPGIPQVYYVGLLAGENDAEAVARSGEGRAINRHDYDHAEIRTALDRPVVQRLLELIRFRNSCEAFEGRFWVEEAAAQEMVLSWESDRASCRLRVDLAKMAALIEQWDAAGRYTRLPVTTASL